MLQNMRHLYPRGSKFIFVTLLTGVGMNESRKDEVVFEVNLGRRGEYIYILHQFKMNIFS